LLTKGKSRFVRQAVIVPKLSGVAGTPLLAAKRRVVPLVVVLEKLAEPVTGPTLACTVPTLPTGTTVAAGAVKVTGIDSVSTVVGDWAVVVSISYVTVAAPPLGVTPARLARFAAVTAALPVEVTNARLITLAPVPSARPEGVVPVLVEPPVTIA
jgi:hypothetical protein